MAGKHRHPQEKVAEYPDDQDAVQHADQPDVQSHVAVEDVAKLVGDHPLQLVARQLLDGPARDADYGIARCEPGSECVDRLFVLQQKDRRRRRARRDRHLLDDVQEPLFRENRRIRVEQPPAQLLRHDPAATPQLRNLVEAPAAHDDERPDDGEADELGIESPRPVDGPGWRVLVKITKGDGEQEIDRHHQRQDGECEQDDQAGCLAAGGVLVLEEVGGHPRLE